MLELLLLLTAILLFAFLVYLSSMFIFIRNKIIDILELDSDIDYTMLLLKVAQDRSKYYKINFGYMFNFTLEYLIENDIVEKTNTFTYKLK